MFQQRHISCNYVGRVIAEGVNLVQFTRLVDAVVAVVFVMMTERVLLEEKFVERMNGCQRFAIGDDGPLKVNQ